MTITKPAESTETAPTQAQIEAALLPLSSQVKNFEGFADERIVTIPVTVGELRKAALTAAAEMGVAPVTNSHERLAGYLAEHKELTRLATIERCARVAVDVLIKWQKDFPPNSEISAAYAANVIADLAAIIRALKDS